MDLVEGARRERQRGQEPGEREADVDDRIGRELQERRVDVVDGLVDGPLAIRGQRADTGDEAVRSASPLNSETHVVRSLASCDRPSRE